MVLTSDELLQSLLSDNVEEPPKLPQRRWDGTLVAQACNRRLGQAGSSRDCVRGSKEEGYAGSSVAV